MEFTAKDKERIQHQFDAFCTTTLKYAARNIYRERKRQGLREVSLTELSETQIPQLLYTDDYHISPHQFRVLEFDISIRDELLAEALSMLPEDRRRVLLLYYFLGMNDREISEALNMVRGTVQHQRTSTLKKLKQLLEELQNEEI